MDLGVAVPYPLARRDGTGKSGVSWLEWLRCPFCSGQFAASCRDRSGDGAGYGVLACYCGRYPLVAGIPVLWKGVVGKRGEQVETVTALIEAGRHRDALLVMIMPPEPAKPALAPRTLRALPSLKGIRWLKGLFHDRRAGVWRDLTARLLAEPAERVTFCDLLDLYFRRSGLPSPDIYDYFALRLGQPRHLVALSFASIIERPSRPILDLACGFGHITRSLVEEAGGQPVVGVDRSFLTLYLAKKWVAPEANYVCCEADTSLPFADGHFSVAFSSDAFHDFVNKTAGFRELKRLTREDGFIALIGLRNARLPHAYAGRFLPPEGYSGLVGDLPHRLVSDGDVLDRYLHGRGPGLSRTAGSEALALAPSLSLVASRREDVFRDYGPFEDWPHARGRLSLNPLYRQDGRPEAGVVRLRRSFPSTFYETENAEAKKYLPESLDLATDVLAALQGGKRTADMDELLARCVVLGVPERYS